jgi:hypothetical protein
MIGVPGQEPVEDARRLLLARERRVTRRRRGQQGQGVEDRRLVVRRETPGHVRHGHLERLRAGARVGRGVVGADGGDVRALAVGGGAEGRRPLRGRFARGQVRGRGRRPDRVVIRHGDPPLRHAAFRVLRGHALERAARFLVAERMQERGGAGESSGGGRRARHREIDGAELLTRGVCVGVLLSARVIRTCGDGRGQDDGEDGGKAWGQRDHPTSVSRHQAHSLTSEARAPVRV